MKILTTSDWHVGKQLKGLSRYDEHGRVLREIVTVAREEQPDLIVVAGDTFDTATPPAEAERLVWATLQTLSDIGPVVLLAGNHDSPMRLEAVRRLLALTNVRVSTRVAPPEGGGTLTLDIGGVDVQVGLLPWLSQRYVVTAAQLMDLDPDEFETTFQSRVEGVIGRLCEPMTSSSVNLLVGHATVAPLSGELTLGGGERRAQTVLDYHLMPTMFPNVLQYVGLGHIHRAQRIAGPMLVRYAGSPLALDFGEAGTDTKGIDIVEVEPGMPAQARQVPIAAGRTLHTVVGTLPEVVGRADEFPPDTTFVRVRLLESPRPGLVDEVRSQLPNVVEVQIDRAFSSMPDVGPADGSLTERSPTELFGEYLEQAGVDDAEGLVRRFGQLVSRADIAGVDDEGGC